MPRINQLWSVNELLQTRARIMVVLVAVVLLGGAAQSQAQDIARGRQLYKLCSACHGEYGQGDQLHNAPTIAGLAPWYIEGQLQKFQTGLRGYHAEDMTGLQMRSMARALRSEEDVKSVAAYITALASAPPAVTVAGDAGRGKELYVACGACHGPDGKGNDSVKSPRLFHQADWYLVGQLKKFRDGLRGTQKDDLSGIQMRAMTMMLQDEQSMNDIAAYMSSLGK